MFFQHGDLLSTRRNVAACNVLVIRFVSCSEMFLTVGPLIVYTYIIYLPDILSVRDPRKHLTTLTNSNSLEAVLNATEFLVCASKVIQVGCEYPSIILFRIP